MEEFWLNLLEAISVFMQQNMTLFLVAIVFMFIDIISGIIARLHLKEFSSSELRRGLFNKFGYILVMCSVAILQVAMFDPNFSITFDFPLFNIVCGFVILMEFVSIVENACLLNPKLDSLVGKYFDRSKDSDMVNIESNYIFEDFTDK